MTHKMLMITTGGTIAGNVARDPGDDLAGESGVLKQDPDSFLNKLSGTVSALREQKVNPVELDIEPLDLCNVDSSDITPEIWMKLVQTIQERFDDFDSFVITHGTNTLGYTCAALSFAIANSAKPIVLTGSQVPAGKPGSDAVTNLENAIRVATWSDEYQTIKMGGVIAVFGSHIISGTRVKKETEFDYDAFQQFQSGSIGRIGRIIKVEMGNLQKHLAYLEAGTYRRALRKSELQVQNDFDLRIASLTEFPGMDYRLFSTLVDEQKVRGFILRAFGAGDPATALRPAFEYLKAEEIPIVVTTQAPKGNSNFQVNEPGQWLRDNHMAIAAHDMSIESQTAKLGWLLAQRKRNQITYEQLCRSMVDDIRGEINVMWETT